MKKYFSAIPDFYALNRAVFIKNKLLFFILLVVFLIIDYRVINIDLLGAYDVDEFYFLKTLYARQFYGFNHLQLQKFFSGFYSYGRLFWVTDFVATYVPFVFGKFSLALFAARMVSSLFAIQGFLILKETLIKLNAQRFAVIAVCGITLLMAYFWAIGSWLHPDWMMMYFVLLAFYYFFEPDAERGNSNFLIALAIAIAIKVQSLQLIPLLLLCNFKPFFTAPALSTFIASVKRSLISGLVIAVIFIILNPYLVHPQGPKLFYESFAKDMASNKTNYWSGHIPTFAEKVSSFSQAYLAQWVVVITITAAIIFTWNKIRYFRQNFEKFAFMFSLVILITYYALFVNKTWPHYYIPISFMMLIMLYFTLTSISLDIRIRNIVFTSVLVLQLVNFCIHLDFFEDWIFPDRVLKASNAYTFKNEISSFLKKYPDSRNSAVLFTYKLPVPVYSSGLHFDKVFFTPVIEENALDHISRLDPYPADYVVVQKAMFYSNKTKTADDKGTTAFLDSVKSHAINSYQLADSDKDFIYLKRNKMAGATAK